TETTEASQIWHVDPVTGQANRFTGDVASYDVMSASADGSAVVVDYLDTNSAIWIGRLGDRASWRRIETGARRNDGLAGIAWTLDGRLLYAARTELRAIWIMDADGSNRRALTTEGDAIFPSV